MKLAAKPAEQEDIGEYTVVAGDSMGAIAAKYYGSAVEEKWMAIYEANKELIGDNPTLIHPGQTLKIPKLSE
jgi:nucleoid-associated protein YgaU